MLAPRLQRGAEHRMVMRLCTRGPLLAFTGAANGNRELPFADV
jgi:hypothetical protein